MSWHQPGLDVSSAQIHSASSHNMLSSGYPTSFDQNSMSIDSENTLINERVHLTGRELQQLLSVAHQSLDEAQER